MNFYKTVYYADDEIATYSQLQLTNFLIKNLLTYASCSMAQIKYFMMIYWPFQVPDLKWTGSSMAGFFDKQAKRMKEKPPVLFRNIYVQKTGTYEFVTTLYDYTEVGATIKNTAPDYFNQICFKTRGLRVDCGFQWVNDTIGYVISTVSLTMTLPKVKKPFKFAVNAIDKNITDRFVLKSYFFGFNIVITFMFSISSKRTYIPHPTKKNTNLMGFRIQAFGSSTVASVYEFNTYAHFDVRSDQMWFYAPVGLFKGARGLLVNGVLKN